MNSTRPCLDRRAFVHHYATLVNSANERVENWGPVMHWLSVMRGIIDDQEHDKRVFPIAYNVGHPTLDECDWLVSQGFYVGYWPNDRSAFILLN